MLGKVPQSNAASPRWPSHELTLKFTSEGFEVRGWIWWLSMWWVASGAVLAGYFFWITTKPWMGTDLGIVGWADDAAPVQILVALALVLILVVPIPGGCPKSC
jgi:hypothetical protein